MMWKEFEQIAGYEVSYEDYTNIIEPMYMATNLSKQEFVKVIDKKRFALKTERQLINEMKKEAAHQLDILGQYTDYESERKVEALAGELAKRFYGTTVWFVEKEYEFPNYRGCSFQKRMKIFTDRYADHAQLMKVIELAEW